MHPKQALGEVVGKGSIQVSLESLTSLAVLQVILRSNTSGNYLKPNGDGAVNVDSDTPENAVWVVGDLNGNEQ